MHQTWGKPVLQSKLHMFCFSFGTYYSCSDKGHTVLFVCKFDIVIISLCQCDISSAVRRRGLPVTAACRFAYIGHPGIFGTLHLIYTFFFPWHMKQYSSMGIGTQAPTDKYNMQPNKSMQTFNFTKKATYNIHMQTSFLSLQGNWPFVQRYIESSIQVCQPVKVPVCSSLP